MTDSLGELLSDGLAAPLGAVIAAVGRGVAEAQAALDAASLAQTLSVYDAEGDEGMALLRDIGYRPTFYVLPETTCEVQVSMRVGGTGAADGSAGGGLSAARTYVVPVDAGFANRYGYQANGAAKLTFKVVPVPPPTALDESRPVPALLDDPAETAVQKLETLGFIVATVNADGQPVALSDRPRFKVAAQDSVARTFRPIGSVITLTLKKA
ncbi:PASTA domain-containing protein [uncultured Brevundimonas sp.]|uniref:PASTA domain-containing protein n=1 Tax=uncultured Brevundimonas sp. TaxID=213418 RepID=UPI0030EFA347|tara:strand:- start:68636 stop:69268 length:633 start_codon:yes stop_codon:yes gene_type:complete